MIKIPFVHYAHLTDFIICLFFLLNVSEVLHSEIVGHRMIIL